MFGMTLSFNPDREIELSVMNVMVMRSFSPTARSRAIPVLLPQYLEPTCSGVSSQQL